jgi:hypothetical protein
MVDQTEDPQHENLWRAWLRLTADALHRHRIACMELTPDGEPLTAAARAIPPRAPPLDLDR